MRMPNEGENLIGKVCCCSVGRPAVVTSRGFLSATDPTVCWHGIGLDGKGTWASTRPCILAESTEEFRERLISRFGGKMSFNG